MKKTQEEITYTLIKSRRKTISIQLKQDGSVVLRAPLFVTRKEAEEFLYEKQGWILKTREKMLEHKEAAGHAEKLTDAELRSLGDRAVKLFPERVRYYAPLVGVDYGRITIRCQKTRWGSCTAEGNLNFNCLLMLAPPEVLDSVVVHELCHRKEMNHSKRFYEEVHRVYPEYDKWHNWLKENGDALLARVFQGN